AIGRSDDFADRRQERVALAGVSDHEILRVEDRAEFVGHLRGWQVHLRLAAPLQTADPDIADDADDGPSSIAMAERFADRVLTRPVAFDERRADDRDPHAVAGVGILHVAAAPDRNAKRAEELRGHPPVAHAAAS